jgi:hypothetical protein
MTYRKQHDESCVAAKIQRVPPNPGDSARAREPQPYRSAAKSPDPSWPITAHGLDDHKHHAHPSTILQTEISFLSVQWIDPSWEWFSKGQLVNAV